MGEIKTYNEIGEIAKELRKQEYTIVTTNGSFDLLHAAHINLLQKAREEGDYLIVLLNSDDSVKRQKGPTRPIIPQNERAYILSAIGYVNFVTIFYDDKPLKLLSAIKPHMHVKGGSWIPERIREEQELLAMWRGELKTFPLEESYSTTKIIEEILRRHNHAS